MLLQDKRTGSLVEVKDFQSLIDPFEEEIIIQIQSGEEEQDPESSQKRDFIFPSGEELPRCWLDANYKNN